MQDLETFYDELCAGRATAYTPDLTVYPGSVDFAAAPNLKTENWLAGALGIIIPLDPPIGSDSTELAIGRLG